MCRIMYGTIVVKGDPIVLGEKSVKSVEISVETSIQYNFIFVMMRSQQLEHTVQETPGWFNAFSYIKQRTQQ